MINLDIQQRFIILSLIPLTIFSIVLGVFFINNQITRMNDSLTNRGQSIARHLATASAHGVANNNVTVLEPIAEALLEEIDVESITIINHNGAVLMRSQTKQPKSNTGVATAKVHNDNLIFMKPIFRNPLNSESQRKAIIGSMGYPDASTDAGLSKEIVGWAIVELSKYETRVQQYMSLVDSVFLTAIMLLLGMGFIYRISKKITKPLVQITNAANEIQKGNFDVEFYTGTSGELLNLETSVKNMAASLKKSREELQNEIDEATTDLLSSIRIVERQNKELTAARQQALFASKVKSEFLANMSHEIRTPMNGILGFIKILRKTKPSAEQLEHIETIQRSADNLLLIINDILDISKIEAGKIRLQNEEYNLRDCVEDVTTLLAPTAYEKRLNLISIIYNDVPTSLRGDAAKVRQILTNLIGNAIKFTEHGDIVVRTMFENEFDNEATIKISVTDTGVGVSDKDQHRLFTTFEQVDSSSTRKHGGTGLGLAISKSLAELMLGEMGFSSEVNIGSTFWFTFTHSIIKNPESQRKLQANFAYANLCGYRTLFYEKNEATKLALSHLFDNWEIKADTVNNTDSLLNYIRQAEEVAPYDFIVLGLSYEETDPKIFRPLYENITKLTQSRIICLISSADAEKYEFLRDIGVFATVSKPPKYHEFYKAIASLLNPCILDYTFPQLSAPQQDLAEENAEYNSDNKYDANTLLKGIKILIAEDNSINSKLVTNLLLDVGAEIKLVTNGKQAVQAFRKETFNIVLMDIHMPEMSGVEATRIIRNKASGIPIIALTADAMPDDQVEFLDAGINDVLIKPVNEEVLINKIREYCSNQKPQSSVSKAKNTIKGSEISNSVKKHRQSLGQQMAEMLINELPEFRLSIMSAHKDGNLEALYQSVHKLHGAVSYCDLPEFKNELRLLETIIKKQQSDKIKEHIELVINTIDTIIVSTNNKQ